MGETVNVDVMSSTEVRHHLMVVEAENTKLKGELKLMLDSSKLAHKNSQLAHTNKELQNTVKQLKKREGAAEQHAALLQTKLNTVEHVLKPAQKKELDTDSVPARGHHGCSLTLDLPPRISSAHLYNQATCNMHA